MVDTAMLHERVSATENSTDIVQTFFQRMLDATRDAQEGLERARITETEQTATFAQFAVPPRKRHRRRRRKRNNQQEMAEDVKKMRCCRIPAPINLDEDPNYSAVVHANALYVGNGNAWPNNEQQQLAVENEEQEDNEEQADSSSNEDEHQDGQETDMEEEEQEEESSNEEQETDLEEEEQHELPTNEDVDDGDSDVTGPNIGLGGVVSPSP